MNGRQAPNPINLDFDIERMKPLILLGLLLLLVIGIVLTSFFQVEPEGKSVVKRFGKVVAVQDPGLHMKMPFGIDRVTFVETERIKKEEFGFRLNAGSSGSSASRFGNARDTRSRPSRADAEAIEESLILTGDLTVIVVKWVVQYKINDPDKWLHNVHNQVESIRDISEAVMRRAVGNRLGSYVLTRGRAELADEVRSEMQRILDSEDKESYNMGVRIVAVELQDVVPPLEVQDSFNDVNRAEAERKRLVYDADKMRKELVLAAEGEAKRIVSEAEGYSASVTNGAVGAVARFNAIYEQYQQNPEVTRQRMYIESVGGALSQAGQVLVVEDGGTAPLPLLNLDAGSGNNSGGDKPAKGGLFK